MYISILFQPFCSYKCVLWKHHSAKIVLIFSRLTAFLKISFRLCCCCCCEVASVVSDSVWPQRWQPTSLLSLGFSRQEHWSGVPFPSPMHDSEKGNWSRSVVSDSLGPFVLWIIMIYHKIRRRQWHPTPLLLPGKSHGWRSLVGCSPWGR